MSKTISSIKKARQDKREKTGWTLEEIKKNADKELQEFEKLTGNEPKDLISGNMDKIIEGEENDSSEES